MTTQKDFEEAILKFKSFEATKQAQSCYALALQMAEQAYNAGYESCADSINKLQQPQTFQDYQDYLTSQTPESV